MVWCIQAKDPLTGNVILCEHSYASYPAAMAAVAELTDNAVPGVTYRAVDMPHMPLPTASPRRQRSRTAEEPPRSSSVVRLDPTVKRRKSHAKL